MQLWNGTRCGELESGDEDEGSDGFENRCKCRFVKLKVQMNVVKCFREWPIYVKGSDKVRRPDGICHDFFFGSGMS